MVDDYDTTPEALGGHSNDELRRRAAKALTDEGFNYERLEYAHAVIHELGRRSIPRVAQAR